MPERLEVQRAVAASAGEIFAVLTNTRGHVAIDGPRAASPVTAPPRSRPGHE